ncbi:hypothetical protein CPB86DRAFT_786597 [Serendipita vermifera]|nr:hypothetical protein CPB86DRAFT_786597 [Serendipita vermifera]
MGLQSHLPTSHYTSTTLYDQTRTYYYRGMKPHYTTYSLRRAHDHLDTELVRPVWASDTSHGGGCLDGGLECGGFGFGYDGGGGGGGDGGGGCDGG